MTTGNLPSQNAGGQVGLLGFADATVPRISVLHVFRSGSCVSLEHGVVGLKW